MIPKQVYGLSNIESLTAGGSHSLSLNDDGTIWAWGANNYGQLGDGTATNKLTPVQVSGLSDVINIGAGSSHSLAVKSDSSVWAWGSNSRGQLGDGGTTARYMPVQVAASTGFGNLFLRSLAVNIPDNIIETGGTQTNAGIISIVRPVGEDLPVSLAASDPSVIQVPPTIHVGCIKFVYIKIFRFPFSQ